ncbi:hypothetical protein MNBD_GAMMA07-1504 [hydrothermal vent metagenome]|uniref:Uncharacterized protein n=1 Tax=hydrothermal vent metagenome TaxID=652676 RepID=A0A3B0XNS6_9ZZZZ
MINVNFEFEELVVTDIVSWEKVWQRAIAYYWTHFDSLKEEVPLKDTLWHVLNALEVKNIKQQDDGVVAFYTGDSSASHKIVEVKINDGSRYPLPQYNTDDAFKPINGWDNIAVGLTIRIPKRPDDQKQEVTLLSEYVQLGMFYPFGQTSIGAFASESKGFTPSSFTSDTNYGINAQTTISQGGDRTGTEEVDGNLAWLQFVPRLVAYVWSDQSDYNRSELNLNLNFNQELTDNLGYKINDNLILNVEYAPDVSNSGSSSSYNDFVSLITVEFPMPPKNNKPMALADLIAKGANNPFTST